MSSILSTLNTGSTVQDYEFTKKSSQDLSAVISSGDFKEKSAEAIYTYLISHMSYARFCDYLRRYLYLGGHFDKPYAEVTDKEFSELILSSFEQNRMPVVPGDSTRKPASVVKSWLKQATVRRPVIFRLGFGLKMKPEDVELFLKKVINESSFNMTDPTEAVYQYCYYNQLGYDKACSLLDYYRSIDKDSPPPAASGLRIGKMRTDEEMQTYLRFMKTKLGYDRKQDKAYDMFDILLGKVKSIIAGQRRSSHLAHDSADMATGHTVGLETSKISNQIVEETIYSGISFTEDGNLQSMSDSTLKEVFQRYRLSRARIGNIQRRRIFVERFDLITLLFFIYTQEDSDRFTYDPKELCLQFMDEINRILVQCGMIRLYPVNPYESFILLCLLSEDPWDSFCEVWYQSYHD